MGKKRRVMKEKNNLVFRSYSFWQTFLKNRNTCDAAARLDFKSRKYIFFALLSSQVINRRKLAFQLRLI